MGANPDPDNLICKVPYPLDQSRYLFFGPCKRSLRGYFKKNYLKNARHKKIYSENIFLFGFNASNHKKIRKIIFIGKVLDLFTFEQAYLQFERDIRFERLFLEFNSPLHVKPIYSDSGTFIGYNHINCFHNNIKKGKREPEWVYDIIDGKVKSSKDLYQYNPQKDEIILIDPSKREETFLLDCIFICETLYYADEKWGGGIPINDDMLSILAEIQQVNTENLTNYAIFGFDTVGNAKGLKGTCQIVENDELTRKFLKECRFSREEIPHRTQLNEPKNFTLYDYYKDYKEG